MKKFEEIKEEDEIVNRLPPFSLAIGNN